MEYLRQKHNEIEEKYRPHMGYIYGLIANFLYALYDYKIRDTSTVPTFQLLSYRAIANLLMVVFYTRSTNTSLMYTSKQLNKTFLVSGIIMVGVAYFGFYGFQRANLSEAIALCQLIPVMTTILGIIFLKEASDIAQSLVTVLSIIGAVLILKPPFIFSSEGRPEQEENPERYWGNISILGSALCFAISLILSRKMAVQKVDPQVGMFYSSIFLCMVSGLGVISQGYRSLDSSELINVFWICILSFVSHSFFLKALKYDGAGNVSLTSYAEIPFGYALDVMFFEHVPELLSTVGVILIFSCLFVQILKDSIFKFIREKIQKKQPKLEGVKEDIDLIAGS